MLFTLFGVYSKLVCYETTDFKYYIQIKNLLHTYYKILTANSNKFSYNELSVIAVNTHC